MAIGTSLAIAGIASAAGGAYNAYKQSSAAKKAAKVQSQAASQAQDYMRQSMGQIGQLYSPYINSGAGAMSTLSRLTTPGPGARFASPGPGPAPGMGMGPPPGYAMPRGGPPMGGGGMPPRGPYPMAEGGDMMVNEPTLFLAGEAGPERATFQPQQGGAQGQWGGFGSMMPPGQSLRRPPGPQGMPRGLATRPGALQGAMMGGPFAAGANAMRSMGPLAGLYGGGGPPPRPGGMGGGLRIGAGGMGMYGEPLPPPQSGGMFGGGQFINNGEGPPGYTPPQMGPYGGPSGGFRSPRPGGYAMGQLGQGAAGPAINAMPQFQPSDQMQAGDFGPPPMMPQADPAEAQRAGAYRNLMMQRLQQG